MKTRLVQILALSLPFLFVQTALAEPISLRLAPGARGEIALEENPSTGYVWRIDAAKSVNAEIVGIENCGFTRPAVPEAAPARIGAPGVHKWTVEALAAGGAKILFVLERPFEHGKRPVRTQEVEVTVESR